MNSEEQNTGVIDRMEDGYAVLLIGTEEKERHYPVSNIYEGAKKGSGFISIWAILRL